jgi:hypothetical protein
MDPARSAAPSSGTSDKFVWHSFCFISEYMVLLLAHWVLAPSKKKMMLGTLNKRKSTMAEENHHCSKKQKRF